jgi:HlyD family secretion protein
VVFSMAKLVSLSTIALVAVATTVSSLGTAFSLRQTSATKAVSQPRRPVVQKVSALGRLEPQAEVTQISAPMILERDRVAELRVKQGDVVEAGQVIAILDSRDRLQLALKEADEQVKIAQSRLAQVRTGAKTGEIEAQRATIAKLEAELAGEIATQDTTILRRQLEVNNGLTEARRFRSLYKEGAITTADLDQKTLLLETAQTQLKEASAQKQQAMRTLQAQIIEARATLSRIAEVRPVDLDAAQGEIDRALALRERAANDLVQAYVRAPSTGQILKVHAKVGEKLNDKGIAELGQTQQMVVVAEVYQTDITKVKVGQSASVTSPTLSRELRGTVEDIGLQVTRQSILSTRPGENLDRRVIEVKIRLSPEDSKRVASLTNLQVQVAISM